MKKIFGTKTRAEREDEEAERLIRRSPKVKPPRRDLRREIIQETDRDKERDLVKKKEEGEGEVEKKAFSLIRSLFAKGELVPVKRKEDNKVVNVSKETLTTNPSEYEKVEDTSSKEGPSEKEIDKLLETAKSDPKVEHKLRALFDPASLGGIVEANPQMDAGTLVGLPKGLISIGDLKKKLAPHINSKGFVKAPKKKKDPEENPSSQDPSKPTQVPVGPFSEKETSDSPPAEGPAKPSSEESKGPTSKEPKSKGERDKGESKPARRKFSEEEQFRARERLYAALPPNLARKFFDAHPDDVRNILSEYKAFKAAKVDVPIEKLAETFQLDPEKVPPPKEVLVGAKKVPLDSLPKEEQEERIRSHQLTVVAASMAARSAAIKKMRSAKGLSGAMAARIVDSSLKVLALPKGGPREEAQRKEAKKLFLKNSSPKVNPSSERFGGGGSENVNRTPESSRKEALSNVARSQRALLRAVYSGEDFAYGLSRFGPNKKDTPREIASKLGKAEKFFSTSRGSEIDTLHLFLSRVRETLEKMEVPQDLLHKVDSLSRQNFKRQNEVYEAKLKSWRKKHKSDPPSGVFERPTTLSNDFGLQGTQSKLRDIFASRSPYSPYSTTLSGVTTGMDKKAIQAAEQALSGLDRMASTIEANHAKWGMDPRLASALLRSLDKIADDLESSVMGEDSMLVRQAGLLGLKEAALLEGDADEDYMSAFDAPSEVLEGDSDESEYMSLFDEDETKSVHDVA